MCGFGIADTSSGEDMSSHSSQSSNSQLLSDGTHGVTSLHGSSSPPPCTSSQGSPQHAASAAVQPGEHVTFGAAASPPSLVATPVQGPEPDGSQLSAMDQIFVRAEAQNSCDMSSRLVSMEIGNLPQRDGERCNIEFSFEVGVDNVKDIISEMLEELNLDLCAVDTHLIEGKIDQELQRCAQGLHLSSPARLVSDLG
jgi:hypothetical protein